MPQFASEFPTRRTHYSRLDRMKAGFESAQPLGSAAAIDFPPAVLHRFVLGVDTPSPSPMQPKEVEALKDPFAELLLKRGQFPLTLKDLLSQLDLCNADPGGLPTEYSFVVADGGKILWSPETQTLNRFFRLAVARSRGSEFGILISSSTAVDSADTDAFLQVIGWDPVNEVYNYYERRGGTWSWAGDSWHALRPESRGKGPFDSHVNGSLVMKELKLPWSHWHSQSSAITPDALHPQDPLRDEPLFVRRMGAEILQVSIIQPGIDRWTKSRISKVTKTELFDPRPLLRHLVETTTVNLISADVPSASVVKGQRLRLPVTFFLNADGLFNYLEIDADVSPVEVEGAIYLDSLKEFDFALRQDTFRQLGDTHFAFLVPEAAYEDLAVLGALLTHGIVSPRFAACLLMVDYPNPVYSARRLALVRHMPASAARAGAGWDLEACFVDGVRAGSVGLPADSPEHEFLSYWDLGDGRWKERFRNLIESYFQAMQRRADTREGFFDFVRVAESRRRQFRRLPLAEFPLTLPTTNIPDNAPHKFLRADGTIYS